MSDSVFVVRKPRVLADFLPKSLIRDVALVAGYAAFIGLFAQISFHLPFTPVPFTGQTFAVLLGAATLGWSRAALGSSLYALAGVAGVPWFAGGTSGLHVAVGPDFGYILSYVVVSIVVGRLAQSGLDRKLIGTIMTMTLGSVLIYVVGVTWLAFSLHLNALKAISLGMLPFLPGDAFKLALAAFILPATWHAVNRLSR